MKDNSPTKNIIIIGPKERKAAKTMQAGMDELNTWHLSGFIVWDNHTKILECQVTSRGDPCMSIRLYKARSPGASQHTKTSVRFRRCHEFFRSSTRRSAYFNNFVRKPMQKHHNDVILYWTISWGLACCRTSYNILYSITLWFFAAWLRSPPPLPPITVRTARRTLFSSSRSLSGSRIS